MPNTYVFVNRVYPPAGGATGELLRELAEELAKSGARVLVITGAAEGRQRKETINGVEIVRVWSPSLRRSSHWKRALGYAVLYPQFAWKIMRLGEVDALVTMTDPPVQMTLAAWFGKRAVRKIHWAQDVYPELAEKLGVIPEGGHLSRILKRLAGWALKKHHDIIVLGHCMREEMIRRGIHSQNIEVIANWSSLSLPTEENIAKERRRLGWEGKFVVLYSGNVGLAHDFETIAKAIGTEESGIHFVFAGEGPRLRELQTALQSKKNVEFLPSQPKENLAVFLASADLHLVSVREGLAGLVVPSKAYGVIAVGRPMIYIGEESGEIARVLNETGSGMVLANKDSERLSQILVELSEDRARVRAMAGQARKLADRIGFHESCKKWKEILQS